MRFRPMILASALTTASFVPAWSENTVSITPTAMPVLQTSQTIIGQSIAYPAGTAEVTAVVITIAPGGETGWHLHSVPLFGYMLEGQLTVDYGDKGTHTYAIGDGLVEAMNWPHNGMNKGAVPVRILAIYAGAKGIANAEAVAH